MILNIYSWIFPAAFFAAAGLYEFSVAVWRWIKQRDDRSGNIIWFYILISVSIGILTVSSFFINWSLVNWSLDHLYFGLFFLVVFYTGFLFKYILGLPLIVIMGVVVLIFTLYFQDWAPVGRETPAVTFRVLSNDHKGIKLELQRPGAALEFLERDESSLDITFELYKVDPSLFFSKLRYYSRILPFSGNKSKTGGLERFARYVADNTFLLHREILSVSVGKQPILYEYAVIIEPDKGLSIVKLSDIYRQNN